MFEEIEIHIDRIILDGFDHLNKAELKEVIREHLSDMVLQKGIHKEIMNSSYHRKLEGGKINLSINSKTGQLGSAVANGIFNGINSSPANQQRSKIPISK